MTGDTIAPTVAVTAPANGAALSSTVSVTANASDNVGVVGVQFKVDGAILGARGHDRAPTASRSTPARWPTAHTC